MQKMGWFGVVRGHSRSTAMSPFDRLEKFRHGKSIALSTKLVVVVDGRAC